MRIERLKLTTGTRGVDEPLHAGYLPRAPSDRDEAILMIEEHIERFAHHGYEPQYDHWWCRNRNDGKLTILVIRS